nr:MAG TPA: hypothetical protein [Caudoviricetes sp.]
MNSRACSSLILSFSFPAVSYVLPAAGASNSGEIADHCKHDVSATPSW